MLQTPSLPALPFDHYLAYQELTELLQAYAAARPDLVRLETIGKSHEGRDIFLLTVTRFSTGPDDEKPALWVDANIHATEVSPTTACLTLLHKLLAGDGEDPEVTRALDSRVFYLCPRVNPDGAEVFLCDRPRYLRSSTRPYPWDETPVEGLRKDDVDGDGRQLTMRVPDPNGAWKIHPDEPRLMVRRDPTETGGAYYRLLPEGRIENYDGVTINLQRPREGLDLNRNFPSQWRQEHEQYGAGPFPTSEPEVRAMVAFITSHPNITGGVTFHTYSGVLLRPYGTQADDAFPAEDLWTYEKIGAKGTELTGYPVLNVWSDFKYHPKEVITGVFDDWLYDHLGVFAWTTELWSPTQQAGIHAPRPIDWHREHSVEDDLTMLRWNDEKLDGRGFVAWRSFEHPELGPVEIGGWDVLYAFRNPPPQFLEAEVKPHAEWLLWHALISPRLELFTADAVPLGEGVCRVRLVVHNTGWLPSYVTKKALERKITRGVLAEITLPEGAELVTGLAREEGPQLEGRAYKGASGGPDPTNDRAKFEWVVRAPAGSEVHLLAKHDRAGVVRTSVTLA
ncbi:MAG: M14 family metallopeptidase [Actinomycetota bacterium]